MAINGRRHLCIITTICVIVTLPIILKLYKIENHLLGDASEDISIVILNIVTLKLFTDICVLLCFILFRFYTSKQHKCLFFITLFIVLKCFDTLVFIIIAALLLKYGYVYIMFLNVFEGSSMILLFAVILFVAYWSSLFLIYTFVILYKNDSLRSSDDNANRSKMMPYQRTIQFV